MLLDEIEQLSQLANQLLLLSREDADRSGGQQREPVQFDRLIADALAHFQPVADTRTIRISPSTVSCSIEGDRERLRQLVWNLLDNALKFTPAGGQIRLALKVDNGEAVFSVTDSGMGIAPEHLDKIFNRFYRVDTARQGTGAGLGLSICRAIAEAHGGVIAVASELGKGTEFTVRFPCTRPAE
jgi:signal transduction histidine kinase